ncbi:aspartyl protease family protein [Methylopila capsulata]|uniref:Aspartyl protease family protein n=1 Tax=Methylopila capsulata TaxID=61654 RepID=A0ABS2T647_9HYPH|nr:aspartyl protease family protein [Methylopila capsulata]
MIKMLVVTAGLVAGAAFVAPQLLERGQTPPAALSARPAAPTAPAASDGGVLTLRAGPDGHYRTEALISGRRVPVLVDTGASVVALSYEQGQALGLVAGGDRFDVTVSTANGQVGAKRVVLRDVRLGSIIVRDVAALVLTRGAMDGNLLGMSFLSRLRRMEANAGRLTLER